MEDKKDNIQEELEELRKEYNAAKDNLANERITDRCAIDQSIRFGLDALKLAKRKWILLSVGGMLAFAVTMIIIYKMIPSPVVLISTGLIILLYAASFVFTNTSRIDGLYSKDSATFIKGVQKQQNLQYWFIRIYLIAFCFWAGFMLTIPFFKIDSIPERIAFLVVIVLFLALNMLVTVRMHNTVIGAYEGLLFDNSEIRENLRETYYSEESIKARKFKSAKDKYILCIGMVIVMSAILIWNIIRVVKGHGIVSLLPIYAVFIILFIILARANKKEMR